MIKKIASITAALLLLSGTIGPESVSALSADQDTDGDGIPDLQEDIDGNGTLDAGETDPYNTDTDAGGESDGSEVKARRNPLDKSDDLTADTDGDGWVNGIELVHDTDPKKPDTDDDGINDPADPFPLDPKYSIDTDRNGLPDDWEQLTKLNEQTIPQSRADDPDGDGLTNAEEFARGTSPTDIDSDHDGIDDKTELNEGTNPRESACLLFPREDRPFDDTKNHWSMKDVTLLKSIRILPQKLPLIRGYARGTGGIVVFLPDQPVTRFEFLKMVLLSTCTHFVSTTYREKPFRDVSNAIVPGETGDDAFKRQVIYTAEHFGITSGYDDRTFRPDAQVNRAEALKMLLLAAQIQDGTSSGVLISFSDVRDDDWFAPHVKTGVDREIVRGYANNTFRPDAPITRAEAAKIIGAVMRQNPLINGYVLPVQE